ncbi:MAG: hypothetical protein K0Q43_148 [Ramlibacter sp.]|jgi:hypothetical protein|nr:hypothetical protein [Ramlibacter sp.]
MSVKRSVTQIAVLASLFIVYTAALAQPAASPTTEVAPPPAVPLSNLNGLTIGRLATVQSLSLAADAAKRVASLAGTTPAPAASAPILVPAANAKPVARVREAQLVAIVAKKGQVLFTEWEEDGGVFQRNVGEPVLGWSLVDADPAGVQMRRGSESRSLSVGAKLKQVLKTGAGAGGKK